MRSSHSLDRLDTAFDDDRLVADAGLLLPATLAHYLGLRELVETHLDLGAAAGRANVGDKLLSLIMSALAGGDCIDDAQALRAGGTGRVLGFAVKAASTLGTFLRSFRWGHVRQLDRVSRELLARAWAADPDGDQLPRPLRADRVAPPTPPSWRADRHRGQPHGPAGSPIRRHDSGGPATTRTLPGRSLLRGQQAGRPAVRGGAGPPASRGRERHPERRLPPGRGGHRPRQPARPGGRARWLP